MADYADKAQEALYEALERASANATHLTFKAEGNENDGRAVIEMLRGQGTALLFIEQRLRKIEDGMKMLQSTYARETSKIVIAVVFAGACIVLAILSR